MILSRFWYLALAIVVAIAAFTLLLAGQMYNRAGLRAMSDSLSADSSAVGWYLKDDARNRSTALIKMALSPELRAQLAKATPDAKPSREMREEARKALRTLEAEVPADLKFDALWAVDGNGRVIASVGIEHSEDWELGGFPVVADALHGWIRDDAWVWKGRIYRVVARPVEAEVNGEPVGAVIGVKIVDDKFAQSVSKRTGAAVGFYADGARVASWAPEGFDKANLDLITQDLKQLEDNKDYQEKGRSEPRVIGAHLGVVYARMPGEAWDLGAGFAVGRLAVAVDNPMDFLFKADDADKKAVQTPLFVVIGVAVLLAAAGIFFSILEHTRPLATFGKEALRLAKGEVDILAPSKFRGAYKKIASDINDGIDKIAAKGGAPRRAADLEQVLGPIPAEPTMSAFAVPGPGEKSASINVSTSAVMGAPGAKPGAKPLPKALPKPKPRPGSTTADPLPSDPDGAPAAEPEAPAAEPEAAAADAGGEVDEMTEWQKVYEEFVAVKQQCGEATAGMTFEKFKSTLQRNKDALVQRHGVSRVKFTVYVKDGKAALKASPVTK